MEFNDTTIISLTPQMLLAKDTLDAVYDIEDDIERERIIGLMTVKAKELKVKTEFCRVVREYNKALQKLEAEYTIANAKKNALLPLKFGADGKPLVEISNFSLILCNDERFSTLKFNVLTYSPEITEDGKVRKWTDADDAKAREYIEEKYKLYSPNKYEDAMRSVLKDREYHPIKQIIEGIVWDGKPRIKTFLSKWLKCEDSEYTQEVSRLIFAGGIHRLYHPGCKFDDVPILIGTKQGEGKSTFVRWLALEDRFYSEATEIEGQKGIEALEGVWISELGELLAITKAREIEAVKSFLTRTVDKYRAPYDRRTTDRPRQCIFIGTTNKEQFLTDKTGNRRFYPVRVRQSGYDLFDSEEAVKADIRQCWAEAKVLFDEGKLFPFANKEMLSVIREQQDAAVEDDYREGLIQHYLEGKNVVCGIELWQKALDNPFSKPNKKESNEIGAIMNSKFQDEWERLPKTARIGEYGVQKIWKRVKEGTICLPDDEMLPL